MSRRRLIVNASSPVSTSSDQTYYDLHIKGLGYLNRIREVPPKKGHRGETFLACTIAALNGPSNAVEYKYYDCKVAGSDAQHLVRRCMQAVNVENRKVLIRFCLGDPWIHTFTYQQGHAKEGKTGFSMKARLLKVDWIKIDGDVVYPAQADTSHDGQPDDESSSAPDTVSAPGPSSNGSQAPVGVHAPAA
jgi:hypothetical protein